MSASVAESGARRPLAEYEAVPRVLARETVERGGEWRRRAACPELQGSVAEAPSALEAIERVEQERRGAPIPVPRPPLRRA